MPSFSAYSTVSNKRVYGLCPQCCLSNKPISFIKGTTICDDCRELYNYFTDDNL